jgi:hypothetical protein
MAGVIDRGHARFANVDGARQYLTSVLPEAVIAPFD